MTRLTALALLLGTLTGCQSIAGSPSLSQVRIVDASQGLTTGIDVYQSGQILAYNLGFGLKTTYIPIAPGASAIALDAANTRQQLGTASGTFLVDQQYTVLIGNTPASLSETILKDQSGPAPGGQIALRILDQSVGAGPLDLYLVPSGSTVVQVKPLLTGVDFEGNSGYLTLPAGTYTLVALPAGTVPTVAGTTFYSGPATAYLGGYAGTLVVVDPTPVTTSGIGVISLADYSPS